VGSEKKRNENGLRLLERGPKRQLESSKVQTKKKPSRRGTKKEEGWWGGARVTQMRIIIRGPPFVKKDVEAGSKDKTAPNSEITT